MKYAAIKTYRLNITGKVQGVWFRASAKDKALELGLTGKVWNERDGSVGAIAQGPADKMEAFIEWCKKGPPLARVENVEIKEIEEPVEYKGFEITRE